MDAAHRATDKELERIERKLSKIYEQAAKELQEKADKYFERFKVLDQQKRALVQAGKMTEADYKRWRHGKLMTGEHWKQMQKQAAQRLTETDSEIVQGWELVEAPITDEEALVRYSNELTGGADETLTEATETLIKQLKEDK